MVFFRAGIAPWHDDLDIYRRTVARMRTRATWVFESPDLWDICAVIASSRGFCGSSLHGRIIASAFGLPRLNLRVPTAGGRAGKQAACAATWDDSSGPAVVDVGDLADGLQTALVLPCRATPI